MSKDNYDFSDLDAILAEFRGGDEAEETPIQPIQDETVSLAPEAEYSVGADLPQAEDSLFAPVSSEATMRYDLPPIYAREEEDERKASQKSRFTRAKEEAEEPAAEEREEDAPKKKRGFGRKPKKEQAVSSVPEEAAEEKPKKAPKPPRVYTKKRIPWILRALMTLVFLAFALILLGWAVIYLHPASGTLNAFSASDTKLRLSGKLDEYVNNAAADALGDLTYIKKVYTLQESATVAPAPDPNGFGTTYDPADITALIEKSAILLDGQKMTFDPTADFVPDEPIRYYCDDTILVIAWKEYIEQRCCTFAEVKVAHGSQLRRKLAEDSYSSSIQLYASDMANASNAVVAMNGDFYAFRDLGITAYQRKLYRNNPAQVDSCFFTASGDMIFSRAGELMGEGEAERFIEANDVVFAVAFGPILVDNGELQYCSGYPIGEINTEYSRSCIAMTDELHYLLMTINHTPDARPRATINELARIIYSKNVWKAYTLDGGQTAEIIMMGGPINHVDFGVERAVSDIIYFATAIPEEVRR
ncbi:MAG: phosphodiester glycosidase family protein [Oscillospiraceae bacterium]|nr:phosphodiester glycosidase family protein [Oscillospiraceae bacterium]